MGKMELLNNKPVHNKVQIEELKKQTRKSKWETTKTIIIAVLITGIVTFIGGMKYQESLQAQVESARTNAISETKANLAKVETPEVKK